MIEFSAKIVVEGSKRRGDTRNRRFTIPAAVIAQFEARGWTFPTWLRFQIGDGEMFLPARRTPTRRSVDVPLPNWHFGKIVPGEFITVSVDLGQPRRAEPLPDDLDWLHWLDRVEDGDYFPVATRGELAIWNRYTEPFTIQRVPHDKELYWWLLGFYQAEGSKSSTANDFHIANTNPRALEKMIAALATWGIDKSRLYMGVLHRIGTPSKPAVKLFESLGVAITHVTAKPKNDAIGVLHVYRSMVLMRMTRERLKVVIGEHFTFPSAAAARAYAFGWLDGDGTITDRGGSIDLVLAGGAEEHRTLKRALHTAFGWTFERGAYWKDSNDGTRITLRASEMLRLLDEGAFSHSMNRVRLLLAFDDRTANLAGVAAGTHSGTGGLARWGLIKDGELTTLGRSLLAGRKRYKKEIELSRQLTEMRPELFGVKCALLPAEIDIG